MERLLKQGADPNARKEDGHTPLLHVLQGISTLPNTPATRGSGVYDELEREMKRQAR
jgi:hypothetical protein